MISRVRHRQESPVNSWIMNDYEDYDEEYEEGYEEGYEEENAGDGEFIDGNE